MRSVTKINQYIVIYAFHKYIFSNFSQCTTTEGMVARSSLSTLRRHLACRQRRRLSRTSAFGKAPDFPWQPQHGKIRTGKTAAKGKLEHGLLLELASHSGRCATRQRTSAGDGVEACWQAGTPGQLEGKGLGECHQLLCTTVHDSLKLACFLSTDNLTSSVPGQYLQPTQCPSAPNQQCQTPTELANGLIVTKRLCCTETHLA